MEIQAGKTYRLKIDVTNPHPDRRQRHDWRKLEVWKAGMKFHGTANHFENITKTGLYSGRWSHQAIYDNGKITGDLWALIVPNLEPVEETYKTVMHELHELYGYDADDLLETILGGGFTPETFNDLRQIAALLAESEKTGKA